MNLIKNKGQEYLNDEGSPEYWDEHDSTELFEKGQRVKLEIARPGNCVHCGSSRLRRRMIDLPVLEDTISFRRVRVLYCPDCKSSQILDESINELIDRLKALGARLDSDTLKAALEAGLTAYEEKWAQKANERKVMSIYFPTREGAPAKAQISVLVSDKLYPILSSLTSEDVRSLLGLRYFEELEKEAKDRDRSISQYLKLELGKRLLKDSTEIESDAREEAEDTEEEKMVNKQESSSPKILTLRPRVGAPCFDKEYSESLKLAAHSDEQREAVCLVSEKGELSGQLFYDFENGNLLLTVAKDKIGLNVFNVKLVFKDGNTEYKQDANVENGQILLLEHTRRFEEDVEELILTLK